MINRRTMTAFGCLLAGTSLFAFPAAASADKAATAQPDQTTAAPAPDQTAPAADSSKVDDIIVTAERRTTNIQTVPISISAVSGQQLQERQVVRINDLASQVPGLSVTQSGIAQNVNLRGLGNNSVLPSITTGVAVFHDGLYQPEAILLLTPFYDIADVTVLRGPQGTIVGQNSTGGSLQINSRNPDLTGGVSGYIEAIAGNYNERRVNGAINLPISDVLAARVAFNVESRDSFFHNYGPNVAVGTNEPNSQPGRVEDRNIRVSLLWRPSSNFEAVLKAELNSSNPGGLTGRPRPACSTCDPASSFYNYGYNGPSVYNGNRTSMGPYDLAYDFDETWREYADRYSLDMRYTTDSGIVFRSLSGFQHLKQVRADDTDFSGAPGAAGGGYFLQVIGPNDNYFSQEFNIISPNSGKFTWLVGTSYFRRHTPGGVTLYSSGVPATQDGTGANLIVDGTVTQQLMGIFGQVGYQLTDSLQIQIGARESFDKLSSGGAARIPAANLTLPITGVYKKNTPTGKISLNWQASPTNFFYAFVANGYKGGGVNSANDFFGPEKVMDYEIGWKSRFLDNRVSTQIGAYYMNYRGMQQQVLNPLTTQSSVRNVGDAKVWGIEASAQARFGPLSLDAGLAYNKSKVGSITAVASYRLPGGFLGPQCASGAASNPPLCFDYGPYLVNLSGQANPYSPELTLNASIGYAIPLGKGTLTPRVQVQHTSSQFASIFQDTDYFLMKGYTTFDAFLRYENGPWQAELFGRNLANKTYVVGLINSAEYLGPRRTYGVRVSRKF